MRRHKSCHRTAARSLGARPGGFTLLESLLALSFLLVLFLVVAHVSIRASATFDEGTTEHELHTAAHRALERIAAALELAERVSIDPDPQPPLGASALTFRSPLGFAAGAVEWGPPTRIEFELEPGELDDGLDNDGDGLVDEGRAIRTENPGQPSERRTVLCTGVSDRLEGELENVADDNGNGLQDERGLCFSAQGEVLTVRLTCERLDDDGRLLRKTAQTAVRLRN